jgi:Ankyrin repeats (3 copies)
VWAAKYGQEAMVKLLLEKGADIESKSHNGRTPLSWAVKSGHKTAVKLLLEKGPTWSSKTHAMAGRRCRGQPRTGTMLKRASRVSVLEETKGVSSCGILC